MSRSTSLKRLTIDKQMLKWSKRVLKKAHFCQVLVSIMAQSYGDKSNKEVCRRLGPVTGHEGKVNEVIVCRGPVSPPTQHVIYFGGDVQDYKNNMAMYNPEYAKWDLESTAILLQSKFANSTVFVIKPSEMLLYTFSIYRNFLSFDEDGRPEFMPDYGAIVHLAELYKNALKKASENEESSVAADEECPDNIPIKLVGFSKGCVVINQIMFELETFKDKPGVKEFLDHVSTIFWLDGGHTGKKDAYITDTKVLKTVVDLRKELMVHVTPYQIRDLNRGWIGKEEREFVDKLRELKANVREYQHFMSEPGCIANHWKVLKKI